MKNNKMIDTKNLTVSVTRNGKLESSAIPFDQIRYIFTLAFSNSITKKEQIWINELLKKGINQTNSGRIYTLNN